MKNLKIQIPDMQSAHCQMRVSQAVTSVHGVTLNSVSSGLTDLSVESEDTQVQVYAAIKKAGYTVGKVETSTGSEGETFHFKTNINCSGCVAKVTPALDAAEGVCHWDVDTASKDKILAVHSDGITQEEVIRAVQSAGFTIEPVIVEESVSHHH